MKKFYGIILLTLVLLVSNYSKTYSKISGCSVAGTATATEDTICANGVTTLQLAGYVGAIQWQKFDGSNWINETGPGSTTDNYTLNLTTSADFRALVTDVGCPSDSSNILAIVVGVNSPVTTGDTRCGYGPVTLTASGGGTDFKWYDVPTGGAPLFTGSSFTTNVSATTTFYAAAAIGGGPPTPFTTTFASNNGFDGNMFDIIAINTVTIDSFAANFNVGTGTAEVWYRPGTHVGFTGSNAGWIQAGTAPYTSTGNGAPGTSINVFVNVTIPAGQTYAFYVHGSAGIAYTNGTLVGAVYASDANIQFTEGFGGAYFALTNSPRVFNGRIMYSAGCESGRTAAVATVNAPPAMTLNATPPALCQGQSSQLTVTSGNPGYTYTWSPATGLSSTTGSSVTASPMSPITYTVIADDGTCGNIDSVFISVGPASVAGTASISTDTICFGSNATLSLTGYTGNIQWQSYAGTIWSDETGPGSTTNQYQVSPSIYSTYRAVVASGGCDPDTTGTLNLEVLVIVDPVTVNDTICGPGVANLISNGSGVMNWFTAPTGGNSIYTGNTYAPTLSATTTYYVEASAGGTYNVGAPNSGIGTQFTVAGNDWGMQFDVLQQVNIEKVYVSPGNTSGNITINLRSMLGGPVLNTTTVFVTAFSGLQPISLGWTVNPGTGYRMEMAASSVPCYYNSFGGVYPYTFAGGSLSITGYVNPNFASGAFYYFFYNWEVTEGCKSNRVPVTCVVNPAVSTPTIVQNGTILTSSSPTGNQWYNNGILIPGATGISYDMTLSGSGNYTVVVTDASTGCSSESLPVVYTGLNENLAAAGIQVYPNPVKDNLIIEYSNGKNEAITISIYNKLGELVLSTTMNGNRKEIPMHVAPGTYSLELKTSDGTFTTRVLKQ